MYPEAPPHPFGGGGHTGGEDNSAATCAWPGVHVGCGRAAGICHRICPPQRQHSQGTNIPALNYGLFFNHRQEGCLVF